MYHGSLSRSRPKLLHGRDLVHDNESSHIGPILHEYVNMTSKSLLTDTIQIVSPVCYLGRRRQRRTHAAVTNGAFLVVSIVVSIISVALPLGSTSFAVAKVSSLWSCMSSSVWYSCRTQIALLYLSIVVELCGVWFIFKMERSTSKSTELVAERFGALTLIIL